MAYDPYARGSDNPWLGNLDMPRSNPTAKPGASRAAALPAKKKKSNLAADPDLKGLRWQDGKITREPTTTGSVPLPPRRPPVTGNPVGPNADIGVPLPPVRPFELTPGAQPMEQAPPGAMGPPTGLLGPRPPGAMNLTRSPAEALQPLAPPNTPPPVQPVMNSAANNPAVLRPTQTTGIDQAGAGIMDYIRSQLFNQGKPLPKFDPNQPSGAIY